MQKIRKILRAVSEIFKDGLTDSLTDRRFDKSDYIGHIGIEQGPKLVKYDYKCLIRSFNSLAQDEGVLPSTLLKIYTLERNLSKGPSL